MIVQPTAGVSCTCGVVPARPRRGRGRGTARRRRRVADGRSPGRRGRRAGGRRRRRRPRASARRRTRSRSPATRRRGTGRRTPSPRPAPHVLGRVAEVARVRVDREEPGLPVEVARGLVQAVLPGDDVWAVTAREDDGNRLALVVGEAVRRTVESGSEKSGAWSPSRSAAMRQGSIKTRCCPPLGCQRFSDLLRRRRPARRSPDCVPRPSGSPSRLFTRLMSSSSCAGQPIATNSLCGKIWSTSIPQRDMIQACNRADASSCAGRDVRLIMLVLDPGWSFAPGAWAETTIRPA